MALALLTPKKYDVNIISNRLVIGEENLIEAEVLNHHYSPKVLKANLFAINFAVPIEAVIFSPKMWQREYFKTEKILLKGKIQLNGGKYQILHPKKINPTGDITPLYKTVLQNRSVVALIKKYITKESLSAFGLSEFIIEHILTIHNPTLESIRDKAADSIFSEKQIYALKFLEIFRHIFLLQQKKVEFPAIKTLDRDLAPFIKNLPFAMTEDQQKAVADIREDLQKPIQARRVIVGDVGCGKTTVIMATAFIAGEDKAILMAPTSVLANQLFEEARKMLPGLRKTLVTAKTNISEEELNEADFIVGTHALLYRDLPKAAVLMVDEQHRFGTNQRNLLAKLTGNEEGSPHYFQFSATPIPRTLGMITSSIVNVSLIKQMPFKKDIDTKVIRQNHFQDLIVHIKAEISKGNQVLIIYPLVEESENFNYQSLEEGRGFWEKNFEKVYLTHGKDKDKENVLERFAKEGNILLSTTVVEVGISLPKLSIVIIVGAERLGLATLHQLRGRVSRTGLKGYCFFYTKKEESERLEKLTETINGFEVAELDLQYRKSGDILTGVFQSGESFKWFDMAEDEAILKEVNGMVFKTI